MYYLYVDISNILKISSRVKLLTKKKSETKGLDFSFGLAELFKFSKML